MSATIAEPLTDIVVDYTAASTPKSTAARAIAAMAAETLANASKQGGIKGFSTQRSDTFRLNPYLIKIKEGWNSREVSSPDNREHIDALARSISENGVKEALTVFWEGGAPVLTDGHCRLLATYRAIEVYGAEVLTVPVKTEAKGDSDGDRLMSQIIRNSGKPLAPHEQASVFKRLHDMGWSIDRIAAKAAMTPRRVDQLVEFHGAPEEIKRMVAEGKLSTSFAQNIVRQSDSEEQATDILKKAVETAQKEGKSRATAKHLDKDSRASRGGGLGGGGVRVVKTTIRNTMRDLFAAAEIEDGGDDTVVISFQRPITVKAEDYEQVKAFFGL